MPFKTNILFENIFLHAVACSHAVNILKLWWQLLHSQTLLQQSIRSAPWLKPHWPAYFPKTLGGHQKKKSVGDMVSKGTTRVASYGMENVWRLWG